eukprot:2851644-Rhodomonas_salina.2
MWYAKSGTESAKCGTECAKCSSEYARCGTECAKFGTKSKGMVVPGRANATDEALGSSQEWPGSTKLSTELAKSNVIPHISGTKWTESMMLCL